MDGGADPPPELLLTGYTSDMAWLNTPGAPPWMHSFATSNPKSPQLIKHICVRRLSSDLYS